MVSRSISLAMPASLSSTLARATTLICFMRLAKWSVESDSAKLSSAGEIAATCRVREHAITHSSEGWRHLSPRARHTITVKLAPLSEFISRCVSFDER